MPNVLMELKAHRERRLAFSFRLRLDQIDNFRILIKKNREYSDNYY